MKNDWNNMEQRHLWCKDMEQRHLWCKATIFSEIVASKKINRDISQTLNADHQDGWLHICSALVSYC